MIMARVFVMTLVFVMAFVFVMACIFMMSSSLMRICVLSGTTWAAECLMFTVMFNGYRTDMTVI